MFSRSLTGGIFDTISNILYLPNTETEALVIRMHGLPGRSPEREANFLGKTLTENGIGFFAFDFPGIRESEGYYTYRNSYNLAKEILEYFAMDHDDIYSKIGIYAESFGGSLAVTLSDSTNMISSLFLWSPVLNFSILSQLMKVELITKFMADSGVIRIPQYDDFSIAFTTQMKLYPPEEHHEIFDKIPCKIVSSKSDLLFPPSIIKKQLNAQYHKTVEQIDGLDHNLDKNSSAMNISQYATEFFNKHLSQ